LKGSSLVGNSPRKIVGIDLTAVKFMAPDDEMLRYIQTKYEIFKKYCFELSKNMEGALL